MKYAFFDPNTGAIKRIMQCTSSIAKMNQKQGEVIVQIEPDVSQETHLIVNNRPIEKVVQSAYLESNTLDGMGGGEAVVKKIEPGSTVRVGVEEIIVDDGELVFTVDLPGTYRLEILNPLFRNEVIEIEAGS